MQQVHTATGTLDMHHLAHALTTASTSIVAGSISTQVNDANGRRRKNEVDVVPSGKAVTSGEPNVSPQIVDASANKLSNNLGLPAGDVSGKNRFIQAERGPAGVVDRLAQA